MLCAMLSEYLRVLLHILLSESSDERYCRVKYKTKNTKDQREGALYMWLCVWVSGCVCVHARVRACVCVCGVAERQRERDGRRPTIASSS